MKLLIVEDEKDIREALVKGFKKLGYAVDSACDGEEALEYYYSNFFDLIVLDLNLPKLDGMGVLTEIRKNDKLVNVIILSARSEIEDKIEGLDLGANDFLAKPFHFLELDARVRGLLRRDFTQKDKILSCGDVWVDTSLKTAFIGQTPLALTKKEYGILEYLIFHKNTIVSGETLIEHVWDSDVDSFTNSFKVHINALKKKLGKEGFIKNIRGQGYFIGGIALEK